MNTSKYITVIPHQNQVIVDGVSKVIPNLGKDPRLDKVKAIQWPGTGVGHVEIEETPGYYEITTDDFLAKVAPFLTMWEAQVAAEKEALAKIENSVEYKIKNIQHIRRKELLDTDYIMLPDYEADSDIKEKAIKYRKWLRDMTKLPGYPWDGGGEETPWPETYPWSGK